MRQDIIAIGSATQDVFLVSDKFIEIRSKKFATGKGIGLPAGEKIKIDKAISASGGGATNAAVTFTRQGFNAGCVSIIGDDQSGSSILDELRREGVDTRHIELSRGSHTAYSVILVLKNGERTVLACHDDSAKKEIAIPWAHIDSKWVFISAVNGSLEALKQATVWAERTSGHLANNPGAKELAHGIDALAPIWKRFDIIGLNHEEAAILTGIPYTKEHELFSYLDERIGGIFVMTKGPEGVVISDGNFLYYAGIPTKEIVDRTGAGDAFHSGFLIEFIRSGSIERAIQFATANATSVVMQYVSKAGILKKGETGKWPLVSVRRERIINK